jgi:hypothetical protein
MILEWFHLTELPPTEVHSVVRDILTSLYGEFATVSRSADLKFRSWLQFAAHAAWCQLMESRVEAGGDELAQSNLALLLSVEAHDGFLKTLDAECDRQRRGEVLHRVKPIVPQGDWEAFFRVILQNQPVTEAAHDLQCKPTAVCFALFRVQNALHSELARLEETI